MSQEGEHKNGKNAVSVRSQYPSISERLLDSVTPADKQAMAVEALRLKLAAEAAEREAKRRHDSSSVEMAQHIGLVREHEKIKSDYNISSTFETASGRTEINVSKRTNMSAIVIAVVVAVIFLVLFYK